MKKKIPRPNSMMLEKLYPSSPPPPPPQQALQIRNPPPKPLRNPQILFPNPCLSKSPNHNNFIDFLKTHLKPPLSPENLLRFLNKKLRHNPSFAQYDLHVFHWAPEADDTFRHDHSTVEWTARSLSASSRLSELAELLSYFAANPCPCSDGGIFCCPETEPIFGFAIDAFCRAGRFDVAVHAFDTMTRLIDGRPGVAICNSVINGLVKRNRFEEALAFYERTVKKERVEPDVYTFNIMLSGYCRNKRIDSALELFTEMKGKGCSPNVVSFNTLIRGFFRDGRVEEAVGLAYEMVDLGLEFSATTCEIVVDGLCRVGRTLQACSLLVDLARKQVVPKNYDYFALVEILCENGDLYKGLEIMNEMWSLGNWPSPIAFATLVEGLRKSKKLDEALKLADRMVREQGTVLDIVTFNCLIDDLCDVGRAVEANELRLSSSSKGLVLDSTAYHILLYGYTREGKKREGEILIDEMLDKGFISGIASYNRLIDRLTNSGTSLKPSGSCKTRH